MEKSFREKVYEIVRKIPRGKVATYGQVAEMTGHPGASRAVGAMISKNTDPEKVPCHRVVASDGSLTGYAFGGISSKKDVLEKEGVSFVGNKVNLRYSQWI